MIRMDSNLTLSCDDVDEDYIDMVIGCPSPNQLCCPCSPQGREFEFQYGKETITSPADDLFYKGRLLPLHLPVHLQMVEGGYYSSPFSKCPTEPCTNGTNTPFNISPSESCRVSCDLTADAYFLQWPAGSTGIAVDHPDKSTWSYRLRKMKHSILGNKLKAPRGYFKSLFSKPAGPDKSRDQKASNNAGPETAQKPEIKYSKVAKTKISFGLTKKFDQKGTGNNIPHRRSFSGIIRRHSTNMCLSSSSSESSSSSSSFSLTSGGFHDLHFLRRTRGATEIESSIEAAIAYCKKSQQSFDSRNSSTGPENCSFSTSRMAGDGRQKGPAQVVLRVMLFNEGPKMQDNNDSPVHDVELLVHQGEMQIHGGNKLEILVQKSTVNPGR